MFWHLRFIPLLLVLSSTASFADKPLQYRVWQLQDYNMSHMAHMVRLAATNKINRVQLSHKIIMVAEDVDKRPGLARNINDICKLAHSKGIKIDVWTHELDGVPERFLTDGRANLDDPGLWQWLKERYAHFFKVCPEVDGMVLTMQETAMSIYHDNKVASSVSPEKRVAELIDNIADVCNSLGKTLFIRTFSYKPDELSYICGGLKESKADIIVMSKCQPHDWQPFYPHNPAIGNVGNHPQIVEFDLGYEFLGMSRIPYIDLDYLKDRLEYGLSNGAVGAVVRIERYKWWAYETSNWANVEVFSKMLHDPALDQKTLFYEWIASRYGRDSAPYLVLALSRTFDIVNKSYFALGFWYTDHSFLASYNSTRDNIWLWSSAKWDKRKKTLERSLLNPTQTIYRKVIEDKDDAVRLADLSMKDIEKAKPFLSSSDYAELSSLMLREKAMAEVWREHARTFFAVRVAEMTGDPEDREKAIASAGMLRAASEKYHQQLIEIAGDYARPDNQANLKAIDALIERAHSAAGR